MSAVLEGLAMLLDREGISLWAPDGPSSTFLEFMPERVEHALSLTIYAAEPEPLAPNAHRTWPRVQVRARGDRTQTRWSRDQANRVYGLLHGWRGDLPNGTRLLYCYGLQSDATFLGPDASGRYEHVLNFQLWVCEPVPLKERHHGRTTSRHAA